MAGRKMLKLQRGVHAYTLSAAILQYGARESMDLAIRGLYDNSTVDGRRPQMMRMTLDDIVSHYIRDHRDRACREMCFFAIQKSSALAIRKAALCELPSGKRHSHQRRIPKAALEAAERRLQAVGERLADACNFEVLHSLVASEIRCIPGIGELTVYDVAHRIGAHFGKAPESVHLHRGTREGARAFLLKGDTITSEELPEAFWQLTAAEIEDCLCIYKEQIKVAMRDQRASEK